MGRPHVKRKLHGSPGFPLFFWPGRRARLYACVIQSTSLKRPRRTFRTFSGCATLQGEGAKIRRMAGWQEKLEGLRARVAEVAAECDRKLASSRPASPRPASHHWEEA